MKVWNDYFQQEAYIKHMTRTQRLKILPNNRLYYHCVVMVPKEASLKNGTSPHFGNFLGQS